MVRRILCLLGWHRRAYRVSPISTGDQGMVYHRLFECWCESCGKRLAREERGGFARDAGSLHYFDDAYFE